MKVKNAFNLLLSAECLWNQKN